ncbi:MAG: sodium:solute symporter [Gemmatimonadota bacterium]
MGAFTGLDVAVLLVYLLGVTAWGAWLGRNQRGGRGYFLGNRELPWGAVLLSVVATETSTLTFLSIPGVAYLGNLAFLQIALGYVVGRTAVAGIFLPAYYRGELNTAYALLGKRFGETTRRFTSGIFQITRLLADSVRLFLTAIPLALITGWPYPTSIVVIGVATLVYTYFGGIRAVVWVDALQMGLYLVGAICALVVLQGAIPGGWGAALDTASAAGKLTWLNFSFDPSIAYTFWAGLIGGGFLSMASHGTDQLIVQRLLTCRDLRASQRALVGSGVVIIVQFALFLLVGVGLWVFYGGREFTVSDEIFVTFIIAELPPGITGLLIAGVFAAGMSSLSSSINALASASVYDFWIPLSGKGEDDLRAFRAGRVFTLVWACLLIGAAVAYIPMAEGSTAVEVALQIASLVYGAFLGAFLLGVLGVKASGRSVMVGMTAGIAVVTSVWLFGDGAVGWPWFVPIGVVVTLGAGHIAGLIGGDGKKAPARTQITD